MEKKMADITRTAGDTFGVVHHDRAQGRGDDTSAISADEN